MTADLILALCLVAAVVSAAAAGLCAHLLWLAVTNPRELVRALGAALEVAWP